MSGMLLSENQTLEDAEKGIHLLTYEYAKLTPWLMEPGGSMPHSQGPSNNPYPEPNQPIPRIDTYLFKIHSNIVLPSTARPP